MDGHSGKRHVGGEVNLRKGSNLLRRDASDNRNEDPQFCNRIGCSGRLKHCRSTPNNRNEDAQFCNRIGCSGRLKYSRSTRVSFNEKPQPPKPSFRSPNRKEIIGSFSRTGIPNARKSLQDSQRKFSSHLETDLSGSSSIHGESDVQELIPLPSRDVTGFRSDIRQSRSDKVILTGVRSSTVASDNKSVRVVRHKPRSGSQNAPPGASVSTASNNISLGARNNSFGSRYGLRNLKCNSISDIIPHTGSPTESKIDRRDVLKKRSPGESSSSSRGKSSVGTSEDGHVSFSTSGISVSSSRQIRNWSLGNDGTATSARTHRSMNSIRMRFSNDDNSNALSLTESTAIIPQLPRPDTPANTIVNDSLSYQSFSEASSSDSSYNISDSNDHNSPSLSPFTSIEHGVSHALRRYNLDGVAEMLMALEGIEQDEELTYETNLFLGNINLYDQHRDMRLDIDNMTYEELLALEERMGTVSTALSEEVLAKCLRISIYQAPSIEEGIKGCGDGEDDNQCSICQEEYEIGDEIGKVECDHEYHAVCIQQWLRLKNWCPICKSSAAPTP